jgi:hypothetical protein
VLLELFSAARRKAPFLRLVRVGDTFTASQERLIARLKLSDHVTVLPFVERRVLAAIYRRAALLLQPSEREGFGLPVAEAQACGTAVVASDLPALRGRRRGRRILPSRRIDVERHGAAPDRGACAASPDRWQIRRTPGSSRRSASTGASTRGA